MALNYGVHCLNLRLFVASPRLSRLAFVLSLILMIPAQASAQPVGRPCVEATSPADDFQSAGVGLTAQELEVLYGEPEIGQGSLIFDYQGVDLHMVGCDLILTFPLDGSGEDVDEAALAESLLPADAELVGTVALGTTIAEFEGNTLWRSASLSERFAHMGESRGGEILVVYTYEQMGSVLQRVELRTLELAA
jgi:hypothetical protein